MDIHSPVVQTYVIAASIMCLKMMLQAWITVYNMLKANAGFLHPEDIKKTPLNPKPYAEQLKPNPSVERSRALQRNDLENIPVFCITGLFFVWTQPSLLFTQILMYGFVITRFLHFYALGTAKPHDVRAIFFSIGSLITVTMIVYTLIAILFR